MKIGISGASGKLGAEVVRQLKTRRHEHEIVAISRTPGSDGHLGDYDKPDTLASAYAGLDRLLIIPGADLTPGVRNAQGIRAIDAAIAAGVGQIFLLSATGTRKKTEPAIGAAYWEAEQRLLKSAAPAWTILRMNFFSETLAEEAGMALGLGALPSLAENKVAYVSRDDVAAALAGALATDGHVGAIYNLTGPRAVTGAERAAAIAQASGKSFAFAVFSEAQFRAGLEAHGLPEPVVDVITSMQQAQADGAYDIVTGDIAKLAGITPRPLETVLAGRFD